MEIGGSDVDMYTGEGNFELTSRSLAAEEN